MRFQRPLAFGIVALAVLASVVVAIFVVRSERDRNIDDLVSRASRASGRVASGLVAGLGGAPALVGADGGPRVDAFDAYAQDVVRISPAQALALVSIVRDDERADFERAIGRPIVDRVGGPPADRRPVYYVVRRVTPATPQSDGLIGVDFRMDPTRSAAVQRALTTGMAVLSAPIRSMPSGEPAFFVAKPLFRPGPDGVPRRDRPVALVTTLYRGDWLLEDVAGQLPTGTRLQIEDGGTVLAATDPGPGDAGAEAEVAVGDRRWTIRVLDPAGVGYGPAWFVGLIGAALLAALGAVLLRGARYERRLRDGTDAMSRLADLSRELAGSTDVDQLAEAVATHVPAILGAQLAGVAVVEADEGRIRMIQRADIPAVLVDAFSEIALTAGSPVASAARDGESVLLADAAAIRTAMLPAEAKALEDAGFGAVALLPLVEDGQVSAIVGVAWSSEVSATPGDEARLRAVSEVCTRTLERITASQQIIQRESGLALLARRLSNASTSAEASAVVQEEAGAAVGAVYANVTLLDRATGELVVRAPSRLPQEVAGRYRRLPVDAGIPLTDAVRRNEPVWLANMADVTARYPGIAEDARRVAFEALAALPLCGAAGEITGSLGLAWDAPIDPDAALRSTADLIADMVAQTFERVALADERGRDAELNRSLAGLAELLANAGRADEVVATVVTSAGPAVGGVSASVGVVDERRDVLHVVEGAADSQRTVPLGGPAEEPAVRALRAGSTVVEVGPDAPTPVVAHALLDHGHHPIGAITVTFAPGHHVDQQDVRAVARLADLAGQALERAIIDDADRRRTTLLASFATELSAARTLDDVIGVVVNVGGRPVEADDVRVGLVDQARAVITLYRLGADGGEIATEDVGLEGVTDPVRDAVARRATVLVADADDWAERYPDDQGRPRSPGDLSALGALPLRRADGGRLGVVAMAWRRPVVFDDQTAVTLHLIARLAAQALQRAALHDIEHRVVADLQARMTTDLPTVPGLAAVARYRAAGPGLDMGGDWFAGFPLGGGRLGVIVGDMAGHGIGAVADMAQVRAMTSALLQAGLDPDEVADHASRFVADSASSVATAMIAVIDPDAELLTCVVAGQVPPMLVQPDGFVDVLDQTRRPMLGVLQPPSEPALVRRPFPRGSILVAYTDGLIERRGELIDDGIARLRRVLTGRTGEPPDVLADRLLANVLGTQAEGSNDDVALVVIQAEARPSPQDDPASPAVRPGLVASPDG